MRRNEADAIAYAAEKQLQQNGARAGENERRTLEQAVSGLKEALSAEDIAVSGHPSDYAKAASEIRPSGVLIDRVNSQRSPPDGCYAAARICCGVA